MACLVLQLRTHMRRESVLFGCSRRDQIWWYELITHPARWNPQDSSLLNRLDQSAREHDGLIIRDVKATSPQVRIRLIRCEDHVSHQLPGSGADGQTALTPDLLYPTLLQQRCHCAVKNSRVAAPHICGPRRSKIASLHLCAGRRDGTRCRGKIVVSRARDPSNPSRRAIHSAQAPLLVLLRVRFQIQRLPFVWKDKFGADDEELTSSPSFHLWISLALSSLCLRYGALFDGLHK
eukprot:1236767-Rhodomonas_salina.1